MNNQHEDLQKDFGQTGNFCITTGKYQCTLHLNEERFVSRGEQFPQCEKGGKHPTKWRLVHPV